MVLLFDYLGQGFSTFWYSRTPKSMLYPYAYPQIKIWYKLYPLDKKIANKQQLLVYFKYMKDLRMGSIELIFKLLAFKKLLAYPQWTLGVPPGVRVPQVENCWLRGMKRYLTVLNIIRKEYQSPKNVKKFKGLTW